MPDRTTRYETLIRGHALGLYRFAYRLCGCADSAEDSLAPRTLTPLDGVWDAAAHAAKRPDVRAAEFGVRTAEHESKAALWDLVGPQLDLTRSIVDHNLAQVRLLTAAGLIHREMF